MSAEESDDEIPDSGAVFTFGKSKFAENIPSKFWLKNDKPVHIVCGDEHTAVVTGNGKLYMFGSNNWGQLGLKSGNTITKPTCVKALKSEKVKFAACGRNHTLVYTDRGSVYAAGGNSEGQLGLGHTEETTGFKEITFFTNQYKIKQLSAGSNTSAALTVDGKLFMWGDNSEGQIGQANEANASAPRQVDVKKPISCVSCGYYHSALVTKDGELYTFGEPENGKLGLSSKQLKNNKVPQLVPGISVKVIMVACGGGHTVALTENEVCTFGLGQYGQLGHGTFIFETSEPKTVDALKRHKVCSIACGENHTAVVTDRGLLYTFGDGRHGKLGLGEENFTNQFTPTLCTNFLKFTVLSVSCGGCHMLVFAIPRPKGSEEIEIDDLKENCLTVPHSELGGDSSPPSPLQRTLSARHRRREREMSPEQNSLLTRTLPAIGANLLNSSMPITSKTIPSRLPSMNHHSAKANASLILEPKSDAKSDVKKQMIDQVKDISMDEDSENESHHGGLGDTIDPLNMTHMMNLNPANKSLELSQVAKRKKNHINLKMKSDDKGGHIKTYQIDKQTCAKSKRGSFKGETGMSERPGHSSISGHKETSSSSSDPSDDKSETVKQYMKSRLKKAAAAGRLQFAASQASLDHQRYQNREEKGNSHSKTVHHDKSGCVQGAEKKLNARKEKSGRNVKSDPENVVTSPETLPKAKSAGNRKSVSDQNNKGMSKTEQSKTNGTLYVKSSQGEKDSHLSKRDRFMKQTAIISLSSSSSEELRNGYSDYALRTQSRREATAVRKGYQSEHENNSSNERMKKRELEGKVDESEIEPREMSHKRNNVIVVQSGRNQSTKGNGTGVKAKQVESLPLGGQKSRHEKACTKGKIKQNGSKEVDGDHGGEKSKGEACTGESENKTESEEDSEDGNVTGNKEMYADVEGHDTKNEEEVETGDEEKEHKEEETGKNEVKEEQNEDEVGDSEDEGEENQDGALENEEGAEESTDENTEEDKDSKDEEMEDGAMEDKAGEEREGDGDGEEEEEDEGEDIKNDEDEDEEEGEEENEEECEEEENEEECEEEDQEAGEEEDQEEGEEEAEEEGEEEAEEEDEEEAEEEGEEEAEEEGEEEAEEEGEEEAEEEGEEEAEEEGEEEAEEEGEEEAEEEGEEEAEEEGEEEAEEEGEEEDEEKEDEEEGEEEGEEESDAEDEGEGEEDDEEEEEQGDEGPENEEEGTETEGGEDDESEIEKKTPKDENKKMQLKKSSEGERKKENMQRSKQKMHSKQHVIHEMQKSEQFWNTVLPHYLTLK
ncbi:X-linked retinitis pigmentosa GTPase regulator isoform X1 [Pleurodeles waltl]|uniref:X-linked retinitis pigmentosa GTPase regulator isoform X1 n=1 Tax=Pleurodeles waltl TaxID=8319 RepID=UPI003709A5A3